MTARDFEALANAREAQSDKVWAAVWRVAALVGAIVVAYLTRLAEFPDELLPHRRNAWGLLPVLGLAGLAYLYVVRPNLEAYMSSRSPVVARSPKKWQDETLTRAIGRHGLASAFTAYVLPEALAYAIVATASFALFEGADGWGQYVLLAVGVATTYRAATLGLAWMLPRRRVAGTFGYLMRQRREMAERLATGKRANGAGAAALPEAHWRRLVPASRALNAAKLVAKSLLLSLAALLYYRSAPAAAFTPDGLIGALLVCGSIVGILAFAKALAWGRGDSSARLLGELAHARRADEIDEAKGESLYLAIELLRANHIGVPGGLNAIRGLVEDCGPVDDRSPLDEILREGEVRADALDDRSSAGARRAPVVPEEEFDAP